MPLFPPQKYRNVEYIHRQGLAADRPLAANVLVGTLYFSTDTLTLERSNGTVWSAYAGTGAIPGPVGPAGPPGSIGPQGGQGSPGVDGSDGEDGAMGSPGPIGPRGYVGIQGIQGYAGPQGMDGSDGLDGEIGPIGPRGNQGIQGIQGSIGASGSIGPFGFDGLDGEEGFPTIGMRGPIGATGNTGATGARGFSGPPGFDGEDGIEPLMMMLGMSGGALAPPFTSVQFNDDGKIGGSANFVYEKAGGNLSLLGRGSFGAGGASIGQIVASGGDASLSGPGIELATIDPVQWSVIAERSMYGSKRAIYHKDRVSGKIPLVLYEHPTIAGSYVLGPHPNHPGPMANLGDATLHATNARWGAIFATDLNITGNLYVGGSVALPGLVWQAFTPTFTGLTVGNGTLIARERQVSSTTFFSILLIFGTTTTITGGIVAVSLPRSFVAYAQAQAFGQLMMFDPSIGFHSGFTALYSGTEVYLLAAGSPMQNVTAIHPFTFTTGSQIYLAGFYENT